MMLVVCTGRVGWFMSTVKRITLSFPVELVRDLDYVHRRMGVSRSAFVASILAEGVRDLRVLLGSLPDQPTPDDVVRFRGKSIALVDQRIDDARSKI
jgi:hypothetical protein